MRVDDEAIEYLKANFYKAVRIVRRADGTEGILSNDFAGIPEDFKYVRTIRLPEQYIKQKGD